MQWDFCLPPITAGKWMSAECTAVACSSCIQLYCAEMSNRIFATGINILEKLQGIYFSAYISASSCLATQERSLRNKHRLWLVAKTRISAVNRWGLGRRGRKPRFEKLQKGQMLTLHMQFFQNKLMPHGTLKYINNSVPSALIVSYPNFPRSRRSQLYGEGCDTKVQLSDKKRATSLWLSWCLPGWWSH